MGKTTFCCSLNSVILRTRETTKTKTTLSTKRVFCFQEQKTVLENTKQTGPKVMFWFRKFLFFTFKFYVLNK